MVRRNINFPFSLIHIHETAVHKNNSKALIVLSSTFDNQVYLYKISKSESSRRGCLVPFIAMVYAIIKSYKN